MDRVSVISLIVGSVLPLLTTAATKASWPEWVKQLVLAALSALTGLGTAMLHSGQTLPNMIANAVTAFAVAAALSAGTWKPTGVLAKLENMIIKDAPGVTKVVDDVVSNVASATSKQ